MATVDAGKVRSLWEKSAKHQRRSVVNYAANQAFVLGDQWITPGPGSQGVNFAQAERDPDRVQVTVNRLGPAVRSITAKLHKRPLVWEVQPTAADDATIHSARLAEAIIADCALRQDWEARRITGDLLTILGGTAVFSLDWDAKAGVTLGVGDNGKRFGTGDVVAHVSSVAHCAVEPGVADAERARWWIRAVALPPDEVKDTFGMQTAPKADAGALGWLYNIADIARKQGEQPPELVMVLTYYRRPSEHDRGEVAVVVGQEVVEHADWPFPFTDRLNLVVQRETEVPGLWFGDTMLTQATQAQSAYNMVWSSLVEHLKLAGNARLAYDIADSDLMDELTDTPGEGFPFTKQPPTWVAPTGMPPWVVEMPALLRREMDDMLGQQEISRGATPSNVESGLGLSILAEQADTPLTSLAVQSARAWGRFATMALETYEAKATEGRKAKVEVPGKPAETMKWTGKDIGGQTRAVVPYDAVMPRSRAASAAMAFKLVELGLVTDAKVVADLADLPDKESFLAAIDPDTDKAARENHDIAVGNNRDPADFDDHAKHIAEHNRFRKSARYEQLAKGLRKWVDDHLAGHEQLALEQSTQQISEQMLMGQLGAPPPAAAELTGAPPPPPPGMPDGTPPAVDPSAMPSAMQAPTQDPMQGAPL